MPARDVVAVGASAGGVETLRTLVVGLPKDFSASVLVVLHHAPDTRSLLAKILTHAGPLPAAEAEDGEPIRQGRIYVAPPNYHLVLERDRVRVLAGPRENGLRPAADTLFRSAARALGPRVVGVVLSGTGDDGSAGLLAIKRWGGVAVAQDPEDALFPGMPESACATGAVDHVLRVAEIPALLVRLAHTAIQEGGDAAMTDAIESSREGPESSERALSGPLMEKHEGHASGYTCPECHGSLWEVHDGEYQGEPVWFECRVNHRYSLDSMLAEQARSVEASVWAAINVLEERAALLHKQGVSAGARGAETMAVRFLEQAQEAEAHAEAIRTHLLTLVQSLGSTPEPV